MENQTLAQRVKELWKKKTLSQDVLAKNTGLKLSTFKDLKIMVIDIKIRNVETVIL